MKMTIGLIALGAFAVLATVGAILSGTSPAPTQAAAPATPPPVVLPAPAPAKPSVTTTPTPAKPSAPAPEVAPPTTEGPVLPVIKAEPPKGEALPEFPLTNPKNTQVPLTPDKKTIIAEVGDVGGKKKVIRVGIVCEVCLREGPLEQFLCKKGTKEHEAVVRVDLDAERVHEAIIAAGGTAGTPTGFFDPKTEEPKHIPATGSKVKVLVHYTKDGKTFTHPAQEWIWNHKKKQPIEHEWVFAGSVFVKDPEDPKAKPYYGANSGDIFSISNFPYSTLEFPVPISKDEAQLTYEAKTDKIPPLTSKVWMLLDVPAK